MPKKDGTGPSSKSKGPRNGQGRGRGRNNRGGLGSRSGGRKGNCK